MKKFFTKGLIALFAFSFLQTVSAQSVTLTDGDVTSETCVSLQTSLLRYKHRDANTNGEVSDLQDFLISKNLLTGSPTGYFGLLTVKAVKAYQKSVGVSPTGNVGPLTRSMIEKETCGGVSSTNVPFKVISPVANTQAITIFKQSESTGSCVRSFLVTNIGLVNGIYQYKPGEYKTEQECQSNLRNPVACTMEYRSCPDGSAMPRDNDCTWRGDRCSSISMNTTPVITSARFDLLGGVRYLRVRGSNLASPVYIKTGTCGTLTYYTQKGTLEELSFDVTDAFVYCLQEAKDYGVYMKSATGATSNVFYSPENPLTSTVSNNNTLVEFTGVPTLGIQYDSAGKESVLVGKAAVTITAGPNGVSYYLNNGAPSIIKLQNAAGQHVYTNSLRLTAVPSSTEGGIKTLSPGQKAMYTVTMSVPTRELFSGSYTLVPNEHFSTDSSFSSDAFKGQVKGNFVTVIGETGPYISGPIICDATPRVNCTIPGVRFDAYSNSVTVNGVTKTLPSFGNGTSINLQVADFGITQTGYYTAEVSTNNGKSNRVSVNITSAPSTSSGSTMPVVKINNTPSLILGYDSLQKESSLTARYLVTITASAAADFKLHKYGTFDDQMYAFLVMLQNASGGNSSGLNGTYYKTGGSASDNGTYWTIPAGQSATFDLTAQFNPKTLFAGAYSASLSLYRPSAIMDTNKPVIVGSGLTNAVTIIGERMPYITGVTADATSDINVTIKGVRFHTTNNTVTIGNTTKVLPSIGGTSINTTMKDFGLTAGGTYIVEVSTAEGKSNQYSITTNGTQRTDSSIEFVGTPSLSLQYDSVGKESMLVGKATVKIAAGSDGVSYYLNFGAPSSPVRLKGVTNQYVYTKSMKITGEPVSTATGIVRSLSPGQTATHTVVLSVPAKELFADSYTLVSSDTYDFNSAVIPLKFSANSNSVMVVGETSPIISSVYPDPGSRTAGQFMISGKRFNATSNQVTINGVTRTLPSESSYTDAGTTIPGSLIRFNVSNFGIVSSGSYTVQVVSGNEASNYVGFSVFVSEPIMQQPINNYESTNTSNVISSTGNMIMGVVKNAAVALSGASYASAMSCVDISGSLYRGNESSSVRKLQEFLYEKGLLREEPTGFFGDLTIAAVKAYQNSLGLKETGMVFDLTRAAIRQETCN